MPRKVAYEKAVAMTIRPKLRYCPKDKKRAGLLLK